VAYASGYGSSKGVLQWMTGPPIPSLFGDDYSGRQESEFRSQNDGMNDEYGDVAEPFARSNRSVS